MSDNSYYHVGIEVGGLGSGIITDDTPDYSQKARDLLAEIGVDYIHSYYWPGDYYYAFVRIPQTAAGAEILKQLTEKSVLLDKLDEHYIAHRNQTVGQEFARKDAKNENKEHSA